LTTHDSLTVFTPDSGEMALSECMLSAGSPLRIQKMASKPRCKSDAQAQRFWRCNGGRKYLLKMHGRNISGGK
jgi:hypothetical protein